MGRISLRYLCAMTFYCAFIFFLSAQSAPPGPGWRFFDFPGADKLAHVILYGGLAATISIGIWRSNDRAHPVLQWGVPVIFAVLYGVSDEIHQTFVPHRTFEWLDLVADGVGAIGAQGLLYPLWFVVNGPKAVE